MRRPAMPYRLNPFITTSVERSTTSGPSPMPRRLIQPPGRTRRVADATATGEPLISRTQSTASPATRRTAASTGSSVAWMTASAPMRSARPSRYALRSTPMTRAAPRTFATAIAAQPIGPQPKTTTVRPSRSPYEQAWTALPNGSIAAAMSGATASPTGQTFATGTARCVAKAPSTSTPRMRVFSQTWKSPRRHSSQWPQTMCDSTATRVPIGGPSTPSPQATTSPQTSWPTTRGGRTRAAAQGFQS